jgi:hypothetical protein
VLCTDDLVDKHGIAIRKNVYDASLLRKHHSDHSASATQQLTVPTSIHTPTPTTTPTAGIPAIADSGCTGHYVALRDRKVLRDVRPCTQHDTITVRMPNGTHIQSSHIGRLNLPGIPKDALLAYLFAEQHASPLLSLGVLADHGMKILLSRDAIVVIAEITGEIVLEGTRNVTTRLWEVNLPTTIQVEPLQQHSSANIIHNENDQQLMAFYHAVLFSPTMSTMQAAADAGLLDFLPGFTAEKLRKNKIHTMATAKGHLDANRRGQRSTHRTESRKQRDRRITKETTDSMPTRIEASTEQLYIHMSALHTYTEHLDATSKFMLQSRAKNWYLLMKTPTTSTSNCSSRDLQTSTVRQSTEHIASSPSEDAHQHTHGWTTKLVIC